MPVPRFGSWREEELIAALDYESDFEAASHARRQRISQRQHHDEQQHHDESCPAPQRTMPEQTTTTTHTATTTTTRAPHEAAKLLSGCCSHASRLLLHEEAPGGAAVTMRRWHHNDYVDGSSWDGDCSWGSLLRAGGSASNIMQHQEQHFGIAGPTRWPQLEAESYAATSSISTAPGAGGLSLLQTPPAAAAAITMRQNDSYCSHCCHHDHHHHHDVIPQLPRQMPFFQEAAAVNRGCSRKMSMHDALQDDACFYCSHHSCHLSPHSMTPTTSTSTRSSFCAPTASTAASDASSLRDATSSPPSRVTLAAAASFASECSSLPHPARSARPHHAAASSCRRLSRSMMSAARQVSCDERAFTCDHAAWHRPLSPSSPCHDGCERHIKQQQWAISSEWDVASSSTRSSMPEATAWRRAHDAACCCRQLGLPWTGIDDDDGVCRCPACQCWQRKWKDAEEMHGLAAAAASDARLAGLTIRRRGRGGGETAECLGALPRRRSSMRRDMFNYEQHKAPQQQQLWEQQRELTHFSNHQPMPRLRSRSLVSADHAKSGARERQRLMTWQKERSGGHSLRHVATRSIRQGGAEGGISRKGCSHRKMEVANDDGDDDGADVMMWHVKSGRDSRSSSRLGISYNVRWDAPTARRGAATDLAEGAFPPSLQSVWQRSSDGEESMTMSSAECVECTMAVHGTVETAAGWEWEERGQGREWRREERMAGIRRSGGEEGTRCCEAGGLAVESSSKKGGQLETVEKNRNDGQHVSFDGESAMAGAIVVHKSNVHHNGALRSRPQVQLPDVHKLAARQARRNSKVYGTPQRDCHVAAKSTRPLAAAINGEADDFTESSTTMSRLFYLLDSSQNGLSDCASPLSSLRRGFSDVAFFDWEEEGRSLQTRPTPESLLAVPPIGHRLVEGVSAGALSLCDASPGRIVGSASPAITSSSNVSFMARHIADQSKTDDFREAEKVTCFHRKQILSCFRPSVLL